MMSIKLNAILTGTLLMKEISLVAVMIEKYWFSIQVKKEA